MMRVSATQEVREKCWGFIGNGFRNIFGRAKMEEGVNLLSSVITFQKHLSLAEREKDSPLSGSSRLY